MTNKKAIELSLNFIVILIISIVIFGFGIQFISKLSSQATELQEMTTAELDESIGNLVCEGSDRVCVGKDRKTIPKSKFGVFGLKIVNILDTQHFVVTISRPSPGGYTKNNQGILNDNLLSNPKDPRDILIEKNEEKTSGIGIQVPPNAESGTYIFNVEIKTASGKPYSQIQKLYVDVP